MNLHPLAVIAIGFLLLAPAPVTSQEVPLRVGEHVRLQSTRITNPRLPVHVLEPQGDSALLQPDWASSSRIWIPTQSIVQVEKRFGHPERGQRVLRGAMAGGLFLGSATAALLLLIPGEACHPGENCTSRWKVAAKAFGAGALVGVPVGAGVGLVLSPSQWQVVWTRSR